MQKENDRVAPPWGDDMEEALMAQAETIRKKSLSVPVVAGYRGVDLLLSLGCS
jgi:hypothetical protein